MDVTAVQALISSTPLADVAACRAELAAVKQVRGLLDARELDIVRRLDDLATHDPALFPQDVVASTSKTSLAAAERLRDRANTCTAIPELAHALAAGTTSGDRVDTVTRATAGLTAAQRQRLAAHGAQLAKAAGEQTATRFRSTVDEVVRRVRADDGLHRLQRQRRMSRLRWWLDGDGMWNLAGRFDPATGARIEGRLRNELGRIRGHGLPDTAPADPLERHQHLAALALARLLGIDDITRGDQHQHHDDADHDQREHPADGTGTAPAPRPPATAPSPGPPPTANAPVSAPAPHPQPCAPPQHGPPPFPAGGGGAPDVTVLIDIQTLLTGRTHDGTILDLGLGRAGLPIETIRRWACLGTLSPVITAEDGTRLLLGRETRLASRSQRRALRVLYRTCTLCDVPFEHCQIHHVNWYGLGHPTDIDDLTPLCNNHHHLAHEGGWILTLAPDRTLTVTYPDGTTSIHAPPTAPTSRSA